MDLSVIIPGRNEEWMGQTIKTVLDNARGETEVIAIFDGYWPEPGIVDRPNLKIIHHTEAIGQRQACNEGARLSQAKYIMKLDAHCSVDEGFDVKMISEMQYDWTMVPRMYNLHVFDWKCTKCGKQTYMGPYPTKCEDCDNTKDWTKILIWQPRLNRRSDFMRFDNTLHFQYWKGFERRPEAKQDIADQMSCVGACWMLDRERYWELEGMDEKHGSWGQMGTELACKTWLSGGRQVVNKKTWFAHMFRTQAGFGFPYPNPGTGAREYSRDLWFNNKWHKQKHKLVWLLEKFWPIDGWDESDLEKLKKGT